MQDIYFFLFLAGVRPKITSLKRMLLVPKFPALILSRKKKKKKSDRSERISRLNVLEKIQMPVVKRLSSCKNNTHFFFFPLKSFPKKTDKQTNKKIVQNMLQKNTKK